MERTSTMHRKRGAVAALTVVMGTTMLGFAAISVDVAYLYNAQAELQSVADASALAGAIELLDEERMLGETEMNDIFISVRQQTSYIANLNRVTRHSISMDMNTSNSAGGDLLIGRLNNFENKSEMMTFVDPEQFNTVTVVVRRDGTLNGPIGLWFARIFGFQSASIVAQATAGFDGSVVGFRKTPGSPNPGLLPLAIHEDYWDAVVDAMPGGNADYGDNFTFDPETGLVSAGSDGFPEINIYPGSGTGQLPPGNYGTVDIGSHNNSTADISRQIREGLNDDDLDYYNGEFTLANGPVSLNGDTGISAGFKDDLASIIGMPRTVPLFDDVYGNGNNSNYRIVRFAGIRIMEVQLTGAMTLKRIVIQPAFVADSAAITQSGTEDTSQFVFLPVRIVR